MKESEFDRLIEKYQHDLLSGREKALVEEWFQALGQDKDLDSWTNENKLKLKQRVLKQISRKGKTVFIDDRKKPVFSSGRILHYAFRIAAAVLLLVTFFFIIGEITGVNRQKDTITEVSTSREINKVILADGSIVWLKNNSRLIYPEKFTGEERHVTLQGEALFEVVKDPARPFIIKCDGLTTTVLGTSFNIKTSEKDIEVVVLTGKVSLTSERDKQGVVILPKEKAVYSLKQKEIAKVNAEAVIEEEETVVVSGTEYKMEFEDNRMEEIIRRIEGKFNVKVEMHDPKIGNCMITADFTGQPLDKALSMIAQALDLNYEINDRKVILMGAGCNSNKKIKNAASSGKNLSAEDSEEAPNIKSYEEEN